MLLAKLYLVGSVAHVHVYRQKNIDIMDRLDIPFKINWLQPPQKSKIANLVFRHQWLLDIPFKINGLAKWQLTRLLLDPSNKD